MVAEARQRCAVGIYEVARKRRPPLFVYVSIRRFRFSSSVFLDHDRFIHHARRMIIYVLDSAPILRSFTRCYALKLHSLPCYGSKQQTDVAAVNPSHIIAGISLGQLMTWTWNADNGGRKTI